MFRNLLLTLSRALPGNVWLWGSGAVCVVSLVLLALGIVYAIKDPGATVAPSGNVIRRRRTGFVIKNTFVRMLISSVVLGWVALGLLWRGLGF